jgi:hypothetical protein
MFNLKKLFLIFSLSLLIKNINATPDFFKRNEFQMDQARENGNLIEYQSIANEAKAKVEEFYDKLFAYLSEVSQISLQPGILNDFKISRTIDMSSIEIAQSAMGNIGEALKNIHSYINVLKIMSSSESLEAKKSHPLVKQYLEKEKSTEEIFKKEINLLEALGKSYTQEEENKLKTLASSFLREVCSMFSFDNDDKNTKLEDFYWDINTTTDLIKDKLLLIYKEFDSISDMRFPVKDPRKGVEYVLRDSPEFAAARSSRYKKI